MADKFLFFVFGQIIQNVQCIIGIHVRNHFGSLFNRKFFNIFFRIIQIRKDFSYFLCAEDRIELLSFVFTQQGDRFSNIFLMVIGKQLRQFGGICFRADNL